MDPYQGFDEFVTSHTAMLSRVAFLLTGDHHLAKDLLQVALSQVASRWPQVRDGNPGAYVQLWRSFGGSPNFGMTIQTDVLVIDLDAGVVRERWRLPEPRPIPDNPRGDWESWRIEAVLPEGLLLAHRSTNGCGPGSSTTRRAAPCPWSPTCAASPARSRTRSRG